MAHPPIPPRALLLLALLTLVWGTTWPLFPMALREFSVWTFRAVSVSIAGLTLLAVARVRGQSLLVPRRYWGLLVAASLSYILVWNLASTYATLLIPSGQTAVLGFTMPLWLALIGWALLGERLDRRMQLALALGSVAVGLLMWRGASAYAQAPLGFALGLLSGLGWAVGTLILKRRPLPVSTTVLAGWQLLISAVPISVGAFAFGDGNWFMPSWATVFVVAYIIVLPMCIGNVAWFSIVALLPANVAGLSAVLVPVLAMVSGAIVHGEPLGALQWLAMACSAAAMAMALLRPAPTRSG